VSSHSSKTSASGDSERLNLREDAWPIYITAKTLAVIGLVVCILMGYKHYNADHTFSRFFFAYLVSYCFFLAVALGGLFFVILQHLTRAGWSVNVRRIAEWFASTMPVMAALSAPIVFAIIMHNGQLYRWDSPNPPAEVAGFKAVYLNPVFFVVRLAVYFAVWSGLGIWFWKQSTKQDVSGDYRLTSKMQAFAAPAMVMFGVTLTLGVFDLVMSLDPGWSSTIFGVYFFADCALAIIATIILTTFFLQSRGFLRESVTVEHFHDLGKFLFGFTFFWGYIAYSQYMLQWYGNMPEETEWYARRGATTATGPHNSPNAWTPVILMLLFGHLLIPFAGLLSRHVKRSRKGLAFWAVWQLCFVWIDIWWLIMPELDGGRHLGLTELAALVGIGGAFLSVVLRKAAHDALRPLQDPRLADSLAFENI
jgi:hypothetical protein